MARFAKLILPGIVLILLPSRASYAVGGLGNFCLRLLGKAVSLLENPELRYETDLNLSPTLREGLWVSEPGFAARLERGRERISAATAREYARDPISRVSEITVGGQTYRVVLVLGKGTDSTGVFLARAPDGREVVIKQFKKESIMRNNLRDLEKHREAGVPVIRVRATDFSQRTAVIEYVRGISAHDILHEGLTHGFSLEDIALVRRRVEEFRQSHRSIRGLEDFNIYLEPSTGRFIVIDPW